MKNISLRLIILPLLIISCNTDTIDNIESIDSKISNKNTEKTARLMQNMTPENPANIYDFAGKLHNDILDAYLSGNYQYNTIGQISQQIETIAAQNNDLMLLTSGTNLSPNLIVIQEIINNPQSKLDQTILNSTMTIAAKDNLSNFMNDILLWENDSYEEIYQYIISFESAVIANQAFNSEDKRIILTTSSIARHSTYYALERKDKDWDTSTGHRVAGLSGAIDDPCTAIKRSLVTGIMIYNQ
jgi:23S rRNA maturation-related 3'-5' exoribonuclease YhaM